MNRKHWTPHSGIHQHRICPPMFFEGFRWCCQSQCTAHSSASYTKQQGLSLHDRAGFQYYLSRPHCRFLGSLKRIAAALKTQKKQYIKFIFKYTCTNQTVQAMKPYSKWSSLKKKCTQLNFPIVFPQMTKSENTLITVCIRLG